MTVKEILILYLQENQYDGLCNTCGDCACEVSDLAPCGEINPQCMPGFKTLCDCGEHDWHITVVEEKP